MVITFILESVLVNTGESFTMSERITMILLWPIIALVFLYYLLK